MDKQSEESLLIDEDIPQSIIVTSQDHCERIDTFLAKKIPDLTRSKIQQLIKSGLIKVNDKVVKPSFIIQSSDQITINYKTWTSVCKLHPIKMDLDIIYEDEYLIVINKPAGLMVHPGAGKPEPTLVEGLLYYLENISKSNTLRPGIVHRLDKGTSGALVCAKNDWIHEKLSEQFRNKTNFRQYIALLNGYMQLQHIAHESYLIRDPVSRQKFKSILINQTDITNIINNQHMVIGKYAKTYFDKICSYQKRLSLVNIQLDTGRTHQIRVHAKDLGMPVMCDPIYGFNQELPSVFPNQINTYIRSIHHQLLHAQYLGFTHPITNSNIAFEAKLPQDFQKVLELLEPFKDQN